MSLEIVVWDVKHGNSTYIKTPNEKHILVDLGVGSYESSDDTFSPLLHLKEKYAVNQLDQVIITHPHKDHINDILNFQKLNPKILSRPKSLSKQEIMKDVRDVDKRIFEKYFEISSKYDTPLTKEISTRIPSNTGGVNIQTFYPGSSTDSNINNCSLVTIVSYADSKMIIPGDNEVPSWTKLLDNKEFVNAIKDADILLAPNHGKKSGICKELFEHFTPYLTIISDGRFCDTTAVDNYSKLSQGWLMHYRDTEHEREKRKCLTTKNDGYIEIKFGYNNKKPFIDVRAKG